MWRYAPAPILAAIVFAFTSATRAEPRYTVTDLGTLGGTFSGAVAVNDVGNVAGSSRSSDGLLHAFLYRNGVMMDLGIPFGNISNAVAINNSGQVVVNANDGHSLRSFLYSDGHYTEIGQLGGGLTFAAAINDAGQVVGWGATSSNDAHVFLYSNGTTQDLGTLGRLGPTPSDINDAGQIVGISDFIPDPNDPTSATSHGFLYANGVTQDLGLNVSPTAINDLGEIIGGARGIGPFILRNGQMIPLGGRTAFALNNTGGIVGEAAFGGPTYLAAIFEDNGPVDLNTLIAPGPGLVLQQALGINDSGQIVGSAITASGDTHAFLLTPIPEPGGLEVVLLGVGALLRHRRAA